MKSLWQNIVISENFFAAAASCGGEHNAAGAAASEEPDNPASIRQDSFDCLFADKQRQTTWLKQIPQTNQEGLIKERKVGEIQWNLPWQWY